MPEHFDPASTPTPPAVSGAAPVTAADLVLRHARKLHRAARTGAIHQALPALRRVHAAGVFPGVALSALYRERHSLKRKHVLRTLAVEAGFGDWESFRPRLDTLPAEAFAHLGQADSWLGFLNMWFSTEAEARAFAGEHGGTVFRIGTQAMVLSPEAQSGHANGAEHAA
jgi:hypothetical protein